MADFLETIFRESVQLWVVESYHIQSYEWGVNKEEVRQFSLSVINCQDDRERIETVLIVCL